MASMDWKRLCCPVDHSEPAQAGLRVAADLCRRLGSELVLLHVDAATKVAEELPPVGRTEEQLQAWKTMAEGLGVLRVTTARTTGAPDVAIVEFATANGIDLIVMGTHGRVDRQHMLTGSVAEAVIRNAPCPVLIVRATWKAI
jgi:nucleotide-binding universal stress UspA family protein